MSVVTDAPSLAAYWVDRWLKYGGGLIANSETAKLSISMSMERWRWRHGPHQQRLWHDGWMVGRWRELGDLLDAVPGLYEAVVDHVMEHGEPYGANGRALYRTGEHIEKGRLTA